MRLIVGLGNPGPRYEATRHNAGFRVVETLAARARIALDEERYEGRYGEGQVAGEPVGLLLPATFMNGSGEAVLQAANGLGLEAPSEELLVVLDDLDLPLGRLRLRPRGSDGGQRGLRDVLARLGTEEIPRLSFGVGRPPVGIDPIDWVLQPFAQEDAALLRQALPRAADAVACALGEGVGAAMDRFNGPFPETPEP